MRDAFHEDLDRLSDQLVQMTRLGATAMQRATTALLDADLALAEDVISADGQIDALRDELDELAVELLARQQPVATDLRIVVTAIHMGSSLERMGALAEHVAQIVRLRYPESAVPEELRETFGTMGRIAERLATRAGDAIAAKDAKAAGSLGADDDEVDNLHRRINALVTDTSWQHSNEAAVDAALLSRYLERFADHAVSLSRQVTYLVTGERRAHRREDVEF